jgi:hypothetical protein
MRAGSPIQFDIALYDASGNGLSYANQAAFTSAGWVLTFIDMATGVAVSPALSYTLAPVSGVVGRHTIAGITLTTASWFVRITPPSTSHSFFILPTAIWTGEQYDTDSIYARINSVYGLTSTTTVPGITLNSMVEGDSYLTNVTVPTSYLSRMGWTDLTGATLHGTIRRPTDFTLGTPAATLTPSSDPRVTIGTNPVTFDISWTTFPTGMVLTTPERDSGKVDFRVEVQAVKSGKQLTILYNSPLSVFRQDDNT